MFLFMIISAQRVPEPSIFSVTDPIFSFENHQVAGNTKYQVIPDISGKPEVLGIRYRKIPDRIFQHSYPTQTRPATRYFF